MKSGMDESRSKIIARVKSKGNKSTELRFIDALKTWSISGWRRHSNILGKPDFVFSKEKIAVLMAVFGMSVRSIAECQPPMFSIG